MDEQILVAKKLESCKYFTDNHEFGNKTHVLPDTPDNSSNKENQCNNSSCGLLQSVGKEDSNDLLCHSDEDSSLFESEQFKGLSPIFGLLPSTSRLRKIKQVLSEVDVKYLEWKISELVLSEYKITHADMPPHISKKIEEIITSSTVMSSTIMKNRRGDKLNILGLEEDDFVNLSKTSLLSTEKKELTNKMLMSLKSRIRKLSEEKEKLKGKFGTHCLKVTPADTVLSEERVQQEHMIDQMNLRLYQGCELLTSNNQIMLKLANLEVNTVRQLQNASYASLKGKARQLCNTLRICRYKLDQIMLADVNQTRSMSEAGDTLKTSVESLSEKRKSLLKALEKYERKEKGSKQFSDIVAEYAKTKKHLHHKIQTLKVLSETNDSFS